VTSRGRFRPRDWLDRVFAVGIAAKGLNGLAEIVGGLLLSLTTPEQLRGLVRVLTQGELSEDPHDLVARHLLHTAGGLSGSAVTFGAVYLLLHGIVKVVLVAALLLDRMWAYPWMVAVLVGFIVYQLYRIALHPTAGLVALTLFDLVIVALTIREWRVQRRRRARAGSSVPEVETTPR
jgi:uncharacterized membrane protein